MQKLAAICIKRPVFATMLILSLVVIGGFSFFTLGVDLLPGIDIPTVAVTVVNPGASPEEIETEITKKLEGTINTISGLDELRSTSVEGQAQVIATFLLEKDGDVAAQEVRDRINLVIPDLPRTALQPVIRKFDPDAQPILQIAVAAPLPLREVTRIADEELKQKLETIDGVGQVEIVGGSRREIQIRVDPERLQAYGLTVGHMAQALREQNLDLPGGRIEQGATELTVRTLGRIVDPADFNDIAVARRGAVVIRIRDVGEAVDAQEEVRSMAFLNGEAAVTLIVSKQSGQNSVTAADAVKARLAAIVPTLPEGVAVNVVSDQSIFIKAAVRSIEEHLIVGSFLAAAVIFIFLANVRTTLIAAIAIPTSIIATFALMKAMDYTLNQITMLSLTLMVGIVIDDAIIVLENIYRFIEEKGMHPFEAAIEGTKEIGLAVMATTLSLMAVFLPVGFMGGIVGRFMSSFGLTAAFAIGVSLLVSFTLTPMLSSRFITLAPPTEDGSHGGSKSSRFFRPIDRAYTAMLHWSMAHRAVIVVTSIAVMLSSIPLFMFIGKSFLPEDDQSEFQIDVRAPEGTSLPATSSVLSQMARELRALPEVTDTLTSVGGGGSGVSSGSIYVKLVALEERAASQQAVMARARTMLLAYPETFRTSVQPINGVGQPGRSADVQLSLAGPDLEQLGRHAEALAQQVKALPDVVDVDTSFVLGKPELRVAIDRPRAADLGVRVQDIAQALNTLVGGEKVSTFNSGEDQYDVTLRAQAGSRGTTADLEQLAVSSSTRGTVPLGDVVSINSATGPSNIDRLNRQREVTLYANVAEGGSQSEIISQVEAAAAGLNLPPEYTTSLAGMSQELGRSAYYFVLAISLSFIFMYIVLAAQFESFLHPITILLTLPLAVPFGILSLLVMGQTVNIFSGLGLLLLFGIVKKNAILQIDHTNTLRARGLERYEAIIEANRDRLRPILMTTIALVAGMAPLVVSSGTGAATNRSIGVLVVGGQSLCLVLTLLAVPVFYSLFDDFQQLPLWSRLTGRVPSTKVARTTAALVLVVGLTAAVASAQTLPPRVGILTETPLSLEDAIAGALGNNPDIAISRIGLDQSTLGIVAAEGVFDPRLSFDSSFRRQVSPVSSLIGGAASGKLTQEDFAFGPRVSGRFPGLGSSFQASLTAHRQTSDNQFVTLNPEFPSALAFSLTQPLLRGRRVDEGRRQIALAKNNQALTDEQFRQRVMDVVADTEQAYWRLVFAEQLLRVQIEGLDLARRQIDSSQRLADLGVGAPIGVVEARTQAFTIEQNVYAAQAALTQAENALKVLMLPDRTSPLWLSALRPTTAPAGVPPVATLDEAVATALAARPELAQARVALDANATNTRYFEDQTRPQVDLVATYSSAGLAGAAIPAGPNPLTAGTAGLVDRLNELSALQGLAPLPPFSTGTSTVPALLLGGYGQSFDNLIRQHFPAVTVGLQIALPWRNRTAEANLASSMADARRIALERQRLEDAIVGEVRTAMQAAASARLSLEAAGRARDAAEAQYASEQRQFDAGVSTVFLVLQRQTTLISSRSQYVRAETDLRSAVARLNRAMGRTLEVHGVDIGAAP